MSISNVSKLNGISPLSSSDPRVQRYFKPIPRISRYLVDVSPLASLVQARKAGWETLAPANYLRQMHLSHRSCATMSRYQQRERQNHFLCTFLFLSVVSSAYRETLISCLINEPIEASCLRFIDSCTRFTKMENPSANPFTRAISNAHAIITRISISSLIAAADRITCGLRIRHHFRLRPIPPRRD